MKDKQFLKWIFERLCKEHGENPDADYMNKLRNIIGDYDEEKETANVYWSKENPYPFPRVPMAKEYILEIPDEFFDVLPEFVQGKNCGKVVIVIRGTNRRSDFVIVRAKSDSERSDREFKLQSDIYRARINSLGCAKRSPFRRGLLK